MKHEDQTLPMFPEFDEARRVLRELIKAYRELCKRVEKERKNPVRA